MRNLTQKQETELCIAYEGGASVRQLAIYYGCHYTMIDAVLDKFGIHKQPMGYHSRREKSSEEKARMVNEYREGATTRQLKRNHRCSHRVVVATLDEAGVQRRPKNYHLVGRKLTLQGRTKLSELARKQVGKKNPNWRGGIIVRHDRRFILDKKHSYADSGGYVAEHRLVMERIVGRYLLPQEVVHHINGDGLDNRPENLKLFPNTAAHTKHHHRERRLRDDQSGV